jgi:hypothetical protein
MSPLLAILTNWLGRAGLLCPGSSDINLFRYCKGIIHVNAKIPDRAFDFGMAG